MNELVATTPDRFHGDWDSSPAGDDPRNHLCEYIVSPTPLPDAEYDEGGYD
jgi:hypothetical protein